VSANLEVAAPPARLLIVDDERCNRQLLEVMLAPEGFLLQSAAGGEEALALIALEPPDLILLDVMMPGMNGFEVAAKIKADAATKSVPIIMVTSLLDREARLQGLRAGAEEFLIRPVDRAELCVRVNNLLRLKAYGDSLDRYSRLLEADITVRKQAEADRRLLTERLSLATAVANIGVWERDLASDTLTWDATMCHIYGCAPVVAMPYAGWTAMVLPEDLPAVEAVLRDAIADGGQASAEFRIVLPDGAIRSVMAAGRVLLDDRGQPCRMIGVGVDVTERRREERASDQARKDQLRFKDEFLSHISHELRSPLTAIKQFTSILESGLAGELTGEQRDYQRIVLNNVQQLQSMIDDLVEVTRMETGKLTVAPECSAVADSVADALHTLQETARAKEVTLVCELTPDLPPAYVDPVRLRQILIILIDNAIKFTPAGGVATVRACVDEADRRLLRIEVSDTGPGIGPGIAERIFERLYQSSEHLQASRKGLGLGLYIAHELVTRQGGTIRVDPREPHGCVFAFTLPVWSLDDLIAPLYNAGRWPSDSVALIVVEVRTPGAPPSPDARREWFRDLRALLERCVLADLDVILSQMSAGPHVERIFLAAFADERGAEVIANRIREQCGRLPHWQAGRALAVSYNMLPPCPAEVLAGGDDGVWRMARRLEAAIRTQATPEVS